MIFAATAYLPGGVVLLVEKYSRTDLFLFSLFADICEVVRHS